MITQEIWEGATRAIDDLKSQLAEERAEVERLQTQNIQLRDDYTSEKDYFEAEATRHYAQWAEQRQLIAELVSALKDSAKVGDSPKKLREKHERDIALIQRAEKGQ